jgi:hypothetical protein
VVGADCAVALLTILALLSVVVYGSMSRRRC